MFTVLVIIGGLCTGCEKKVAETTQQSQESNTKNWEPETSTTDSSQDGHDHSGHNH